MLPVPDPGSAAFQGSLLKISRRCGMSQQAARIRLEFRLRRDRYWENFLTEWGFLLRKCTGLRSKVVFHGTYNNHGGTLIEQVQAG